MEVILIGQDRITTLPHPLLGIAPQMAVWGCFVPWWHVPDSMLDIGGPFFPPDPQKTQSPLKSYYLLNTTRLCTTWTKFNREWVWGSSGKGRGRWYPTPCGRWVKECSPSS